MGYKFNIGDKVRRVDGAYQKDHMGYRGTVVKTEFDDLHRCFFLTLDTDGVQFYGWDQDAYELDDKEELIGTSAYHKHHDMITQWAKGANIQWSNDGKKWFDSGTPRWDNNIFYRVKPDPVKRKVRVGLFKGNTSDHLMVGHFTLTVTPDNENAFASDSNITFVKWLTDWLEYEV